MTVKELTIQLEQLPDSAEIQIGYMFKIICDSNVSKRYESKDIKNITKVIDMDTNMGYFVINSKN